MSICDLEPSNTEPFFLNGLLVDLWIFEVFCGNSDQGSGNETLNNLADYFCRFKFEKPFPLTFKKQLLKSFFSGCYSQSIQLPKSWTATGVFLFLVGALVF